jgi:type I restriction enzyme S subunit
MAREFKDSGIEWIGQIPKEWKVVRAKGLFVQRSTKGNSQPVLLSATQKQGMLPQYLLEGVVQTNKDTDLQTFKTVHKNDFVISLRSFQGGFEKSDYEGVCSPAYQVFYNRAPINYSYFWQLFKSVGFIDKINSLTVGIREGKNIQYKDFADMYLAIPSLPEQQKIADYLDKVCGEVDEMVALQEKMIEELKAYKQSVITEAVTKGLNPNVPMKDSGIDWIGEIPEHWEVVQTKRIVQSHLQGYYDADGYAMSGYRLLRITDLLDNGNLTLDKAPFVKESPNIQEFIIQRGDFCFARTGGAGSFGYVAENLEPAVFASYLIRFRFYGQNNNFLRYYFLSHNFINEVNSSIHGGVNKNIHAENIKTTHLPLPPLSEQQQIASYLDTNCSEIDSLIALKQQKIEELKEYKKSIIYEYVTGKKEVA